jgi:hypothetical protein
MNYHDPEARLAAWFELVEPKSAPEEILDNVLAVTRTADQRRGLMGRLRSAVAGDLRSHRALAVASGAALVIVLATAGLAILWSQVVQGPPVVGPPVTSPSPSPTTGADWELSFVMLDTELTHARVGHTATLLPDGRVLIVGGLDVTSRPLATAELWDAATDSFLPTGAMERPRSGHTATLLSDGRVLIVGGDDPEGFGRGRSAELWDPATETFSPAGEMAMTREGHSATLMPDGVVLIVGGTLSVGVDREQRDFRRPTTEVWDPVSETFTPVDEHLPLGPMHTATLVDDNTLLFTGGIGSASSWVAYIALPVTLSGSLMEAREGHTATRLLDGSVLLIGGHGIDTSASSEIWTMDEEMWTMDHKVPTRVGGQLAVDRGPGHTATLLPDGRVLIVGGFSGGWLPTAAAEISDRFGFSFGPAGLLVSPRSYHTATLLPDGRVLVIGGRSVAAEPGQEGEVLATAELWSPSGFEVDE